MKSLLELKRLRRRAAHRQRRLIYDNDGNDVMLAEEATPESLLQVRAVPWMLGQVDSAAYCVQVSLGMHLYNSKAGEICTTTPGPETRNVIPDLITQGTDPLQIMVDFYHKNAREIFANLRMNDIHDATIAWELPQWKRDHPKLLFGTPENPPPNGRWSGADFCSPQVRDLEFRSIKEICQNYDVDGIHMDFLRHPPFFKRVAWGELVATEETEMMTDLIRRIRIMTEEVGLRKGRPILVSVKILGSVEINESQGLDVERWLREDLVDMITPGWMHEAPLEEMVALGHHYDVPVYAHMHRIGPHCRRPDIGSAPTGLLKVERACAMQAWNAGVDGLYMFNYSADYLPLLEQCGDPRKLEGLDKTYMTLPMGTHLMPYCGIPNILPLVSVPRLSPEDPITVEPGDLETIWYFPVGDDLRWGKAQGMLPDVRLQVYGKDLRQVDDIKVLMNNNVDLGVGTLQKTQVGSAEITFLEYCLDPDLVRRGNNRFDIIVNQGRGQLLTLTDLRLCLSYLHG